MGERVPITFTFAIGCIDYMLERDEELILLPIPNHQKIYVFFVNIKQIRLFLFIFGLMPDSDSPILTHSSTDVEYIRYGRPDRIPPVQNLKNQPKEVQ